MTTFSSRIYLDHNATSPVSHDLFVRLGELLKTASANPSSPHASGRKSKIALENVRMKIAKLLGSRVEEIIFCSGATEANNMVLQGLAAAKAQNKETLKVLTSDSEHPSVSETLVILEQRGSTVVGKVKLLTTGHLDIEDLRTKIDADTNLITLIWGHNEVGIINPIDKIIPIIRNISPKCHIHVDGVQMLGKQDLALVAQMGMDSLSFSGHKTGSLKGVGFLYLKGGSKLSRFLAGGGQERGRRAGTEALDAILSLGLALDDLSRSAPWSDSNRHREARRVLIEGLKAHSRIHIHGDDDPSKGLANTVHFHIDGVSGDDVIIRLDMAGVEVSSGSACSSGSGRPSSSLLGMGYSEWVALNSIRVSFGPDATATEASRVLDVVVEVLS